jgi:hypothetical protein
VFLDGVAGATAGGGLALCEFLFQFGELGFQPADMLLGRLVVGSLLNLLPDILDLLFEPHYRMLCHRRAKALCPTVSCGR